VKVFMIPDEIKRKMLKYQLNSLHGTQEEDVFMIGKQDRENVLEGMRALKRLCLKIEKESAHCQQITIDELKITVTWMLGFDSELLAFEASVLVLPEKAGPGGRGDKHYVDLENYLQDRLDGLREHEPWPAEIPADWLAKASEILPPLAASPAAPDGG
jgi:hypothetical protein